MLWLLSGTREVQGRFTQLQIITPGISSGSAVALLEQHCWSLDAIADPVSLCHVTVLCLDKKKKTGLAVVMDG